MNFKSMTIGLSTSILLLLSAAMASVPASATTYVPPGELTLGIDIKPHSYPNSINMKNRGNVPVAILSTPDFDAPSMVDTSSLKFGRTGDESSLAFCSHSPEDVNGDGLLDLVCHFYTQKTGFKAGDTIGILTGTTVDGVTFVGTDSVRILFG
jgi:hypothetical protein